MEEVSIWTELIKSVASGGPWAVILAGVLVMNYLRDRKREDKLADKLDGIREEIGKLNAAIVGVQKDSERLEDRLDTVERRCERRHDKE